MIDNISYLAGIIDTEGTIGIAKKVSTKAKYSYQQQLRISNTNLRLIHWLIENFGGSEPKPRKFTGNCKDGYTWRLSGYKSYKLIKKVQPYLVLKQEQADLAILLWEKVSKHRYGGACLPEHKIKLSEKLYYRAKELNSRGKNNNIEIEIKKAFSIADNIIYLSAIVDGDGSIEIGKQLTSAGNFAYQQRIRVGNTDIRLIEWLVENFGGSMPKPSIGKGNRRDSYDWHLTGSNSYKLIKKIISHLVIKQEQAECAIELYSKISKFNYGGNKPMPYHKRKLAEVLWRRCRELNKVGKHNDTDEEVEILVPIKVRKDVLDEWLEW